MGLICDRQGGNLKHLRPDDMAAHVLKSVMARTGTDMKQMTTDPTRLVDDVGCANQAFEDNRNVSRMAVLLSGLPDSVPGVTVNRLCASGLEAVNQAAARAIAFGEMDMVLAGTTGARG